MVYSIVRGGEYFQSVGGVGGQKCASSEKNKSSQSVDQKIIQKSGRKERESGYHRDDNKTAREKELIHRFLNWGTLRQRPSLALDPVHPSYIAPNVTCPPVSALFDLFA